MLVVKSNSGNSWKVGCALWTAVGITVGGAVGMAVGFSVGIAVGAAVVGTAVEIAVKVGVVVGVVVSLAMGLLEGAVVGNRYSPLSVQGRWQRRSFPHVAPGLQQSMDSVHPHLTPPYGPLLVAKQSVVGKPSISRHCDQYV
jgi:hypothetical protein